MRQADHLIREHERKAKQSEIDSKRRAAQQQEKQDRLNAEFDEAFKDFSF